jgi:UDP-3-O-[3-hydroxymyristoyl] N-acetylglucosamine deacetylase
MARISAREENPDFMKSRLRPDMQTTLRGSVTLQGVGAHSDRAGRVTLAPADAGTGIAFSRANHLRDEGLAIAALWRHVCGTQLRTCIGDESGAISTIEHVMAALCGLGVDNAMIEVDGPEVPAMDGSARAFVAAIEEAGVIRLSARRSAVQVVEPVRVSLGDSYAELLPSNGGLDLDVEIDFPCPSIGRQRRRMTLTRENFIRELSCARSFGFASDAERLWREGLALGASLENTVVLANDRVLNREGLRFEDEFVRHKMLDAIGDLALAGAPIIGAFRSYRGGHRLNLALVDKLMSTPSAFRRTGQASPRRETVRGLSALSTGLDPSRS